MSLTNLLSTSNTVLPPIQPGIISRPSTRTKARRPLLPLSKTSGILLLKRGTPSASTLRPSRSTGSALTWLMTVTSRFLRSNSKLLSSSLYPCPGIASRSRTLVSKRAIRPTRRQMLHPRNSLVYSRRRMCDDCNATGNLKNKRLSTKPSLRSLLLQVTSTMPIAVANAVQETTRLKIVGSLANPSAASAKGSVTGPKTATQGR
jgi:hypothetical protein